MTNQFGKTLKLEAYLQDRDWQCCTTTDIIKTHERKLEQLRVETTRELIISLIRSEEEAQMWANDSGSTASDRRAAKTEHAKINTEIRRLVGTIDSATILDFNMHMKYGVEK